MQQKQFSKPSLKTILGSHLLKNLGEVLVWVPGFAGRPHQHPEKLRRYLGSLGVLGPLVLVVALMAADLLGWQRAVVAASVTLPTPLAVLLTTTPTETPTPTPTVDGTVTMRNTPTPTPTTDGSITPTPEGSATPFPTPTFVGPMPLGQPRLRVEATTNGFELYVDGLEGFGTGGFTVYLRYDQASATGAQFTPGPDWGALNCLFTASMDADSPPNPDGVLIQGACNTNVPVGVLGDNVLVGRVTFAACPQNLTIDLDQGTSDYGNAVTAFQTMNGIKYTVPASDLTDGLACTARSLYSDITAIYALAFDNLSKSPMNLTPFYPETIQHLIESTRLITEPLAGPAKTAVMLIDLDGPADTHVLVVQDGTVIPIVGLPNADGVLDVTLQEYNMADGLLLGGFLKWARQEYPALRTTFAYIGHGTALAPESNIPLIFATPATRKVLDAIPLPTIVDANPEFTDQHPVDLLSPHDLTVALAQGTDFGQNPLSVLDLTHCFAASIEEFYAVAPYALTIAGSPNYRYFDPIMPGSALAAIQEGMSAAAMAQTLVTAYDQALPPTQHPGILVAVEGSQVAAVKDAMSTLAALLVQAMDQDPSGTRAKLLAAYQASAKYDTTFCTLEWELAAPDALSDMADFARQLRTQFGENSEIGAWASIVEDRVSTAVLLTLAQNGEPWFATTTPRPTWDFSRNLGLSLYTDFQGSYLEGETTLSLSWQAAFYTTTVSTANPHPYVFLDRGEWATLFARYWEGSETDIAACLPNLPPATRPGDLKALTVLFPRPDTVSVGAPISLSVAISTAHIAMDPLVTFEVWQNSGLVFSDTVAAGYLVTGTHQIESARSWTPTHPGPFTLKVWADSDQRVEEANESDNLLELNEMVWPERPWPRPSLVAEMADGRQWVGTPVVHLNITQTLGAETAPVSVVSVQVYQYDLGANPTTQLSHLVGEQTLTSVSLPRHAVPIALPLTLQPGPVVLHIWGWSRSGLSAMPAVVRFNYAPPAIPLGADEQHYYRVSAERLDQLTLRALADAGDPNIFLWRPFNHIYPDWHSTAAGEDQLSLVMPYTGDYLVSVYGQQAGAYTLEATPNGQASTKIGTGALRPETYLPAMMPHFVEPIQAVPPPCPDFLGTVGITIQEIQTITNHWGETPDSPGWEPILDVAQDGIIDLSDVVWVAGMWGLPCDEQAAHPY